MKIFSFEKSVSKKIERFGSVGATISPIVREIADGFCGCIYIQQNGCVGRHKTIGDQLFLVVKGRGWVSGADGVKKNINPGQAAFWVSGEYHESGSKEGMMVIVIEALELCPDKWMDFLTDELGE